MPALTTEEMQAFLAEPAHLVRIGTVDDDGMPRVVPTWFIFADNLVLFTPRGTSRLLANLRRDPRACLSIDEEPLPYRKVTLRGTAELVHDVGADDAWRELYRQIARRYVPASAADAYIDDTIDQGRALLAVALATSQVSTWRMPLGDERATGIWARRYYLPGTKMAKLADQPSSKRPYVARP